MFRQTLFNVSRKYYANIKNPLNRAHLLQATRGQGVETNAKARHLHSTATILFLESRSKPVLA